jgi:peptidoglycan-associated lipoprotein
LTGLVVNGWNHLKKDLRGKSAGFGGAYQVGDFGFEQNYMFGKEQLGSDAMRHLFDSVASYEVHPRLRLAANYDYGMDRLASSRVRWLGVAMSADMAALDWLSVSPRLEWFDDPQGFRTGTAQTLREVTMTSRFAVYEGVTLSAEYRHDWSNRASFEARDGGMRDSQNTVAVGLSYTWSPKREAPPATVDDVRPAPVPVPARPVLTLAADPSTITRGQATTIRWEARDATSVTIEPGIGNVGVSGTRQVTPDASVTYTATAIGPGGRTTESVRVAVDVPAPVAAPPPDRTPSLDELFRQNVAAILFDYDRAEIRPDQTARLRANAAWLRDNPAVRFTIEGHADERGSQEYNIGLGDQRAIAVRQFLISEGVAAERMRTVSYGEERPVCTDQNEGCWQRNRRGSSVLNP